MAANNSRTQAQKLYESCAEETTAAIRDTLEQYRGRTDFHVTPEMMEPLRRTERSLLGYAGSSLAGLGLARYLAHSSRAPRYRPGPVGQLAIISGSALLGGEIMAERSGPCAITQVIDSDNEMGGALCQAAERMGPCASDTECRKILQRGGTMYPMLKWLEACQRRGERLGSASAGGFGKSNGGSAQEEIRGEGWKLDGQSVSDTAAPADADTV